MTHRGPFQPLLFCDSVILGRKKPSYRAEKSQPRCGLAREAVDVTGKGDQPWLRFLFIGEQTYARVGCACTRCENGIVFRMCQFDAPWLASK